MLYDIPVTKIDGTATTLSEWNGNVLLVVNVASQCGLTPQYEQLEQIYDKYRTQGFAVLGFPANEFGAQEPGSNQEIQEFCSLKFGVKFPMFEKIVVKGQGIHPLYSELIREKPRATGDIAGFRQDLKKYGIESGGEEEITWNFEKFLVDRSGHVVERFAPSIKPDDPKLVEALERELARTQEA